MSNSNDTRFAAVFHPYNAMQAGLIRGALEQSGIVCYVNNENLSGMHFGGMGIGAGSMAVMVPENQAEDAMEIIKELGIR